MSRYIDADKLRALFNNNSKVDGVFYCAAWEGIDKPSDIQFLIDDQPTADVVEVVRCKDCIYYETCNLRSSHWWKGGYTVDIEFCSFGERADT